MRKSFPNYAKAEFTVDVDSNIEKINDILLNSMTKCSLITFLIFLTISCSQNDITPYNPCESYISINDNSTKFATEINGELWIPNNGVFSFYKDGKLKINAGDSLLLEGVWNVFNFEIDSPKLGYNYIDLSTESLMFLHHTEDRIGYRAKFNCGVIKLEKFDTLNRRISGYFHGTLKYPADNIEVYVSNGVFNELTISK